MTEDKATVEAHLSQASDGANRHGVPFHRANNGRKRHRLSKGQERLVREHLDLSNGHKCSLCGLVCEDCKWRAGHENCKLQRDHINGDPSDNRLVNSRYLCLPCNNKERARLLREAKAMESVNSYACEKQLGARAEDVGPTDNLVELSHRMQKDYWEWLLWMILTGEKKLPDGRSYVLETEAIHGGAYDCGLSSDTTRKYLKVFSTQNGPVKIERHRLLGDRPNRTTRIVVYSGSIFLPGEGKPPVPKIEEVM